jgi:hypothetical protein
LHGPFALVSQSTSFNFRSDVMIRVARWFLFKPKIPNLGKFWRALDWKTVSGFGIMYQEKSGNPGYGHNFLRFSPIFCEKMAFFFKNKCYDPIFAEFFSVLNKKCQLFRRFFLAKKFSKSQHRSQSMQSFFSRIMVLNNYIRA